MHTKERLQKAGAQKLYYILMENNLVKNLSTISHQGNWEKRYRFLELHLCMSEAWIYPCISLQGWC